jgi:hypothetical protein
MTHDQQAPNLERVIETERLGDFDLRRIGFAWSLVLGHFALPADSLD